MGADTIIDVVAETPPTARDMVNSAATFLYLSALDVSRTLCFAACLLVPVLINQEAMSDGSNAKLLAAVLSALLAPFSLIYAFSEKAKLSGRVLALIVALFTITYNVENAIGIIAGSDAAAQDTWKNESDSKGTTQGDIDTKKGQRDEQVKIAGKQSAAVYAAQIATLRSTGYGKARWESSDAYGGTNKCDPLHTVTADEKELCRQLGDLATKKAAADERDKLNGQIKQLEENKPHPIRTRIDAKLDNIAVGIGILGRKVDDDGRVILKSTLEWHFSLLMEVIGSAGPKLVLLLFALVDPRENDRARRREIDRESRRAAREAILDAKRKERAQKRKAKPAVDVEPEVPELKPEETDGSDPQITAFLARNTSRIVSGRVTGAQLFKAWKGDCAERGIEPGTSNKFTKRAIRFVNFENKSNRYIFVGIQLKDRGAAPKFRVV